MTASSRARRRRIRAVVGVFAGAAMVRMAAVDVSDDHTSRGSYAFVAGAAAAVLAAAALVDDVRRARRAPRSGRRHTAAMLAWLLTIPLGAALAIAPTARKTPTAPTAPGQQAAGLAPDAPVRPPLMMYPRLPDGDPVRMSVVDYVTRVRSDVGASLAGRQVELTGYLGSAPDGGPDLRRTVISCCSKRPETFAVLLVGALPPGVGPGTWLRVTGGLPARGGAAARPAGTAYLSVTAATVVSEATGRQ